MNERIIIRFLHRSVEGLSYQDALAFYNEHREVIQRTSEENNLSYKLATYLYYCKLNDVPTTPWREV